MILNAQHSIIEMFIKDYLYFEDRHVTLMLVDDFWAQSFLHYSKVEDQLESTKAIDLILRQNLTDSKENMIGNTCSRRSPFVPFVPFVYHM